MIAEKIENEAILLANGSVIPYNPNMRQVNFYTTQAGRKPIEEFLDSLTGSIGGHFERSG
jgi:hypothetical protein